jgi:hypothetical protein
MIKYTRKKIKSKNIVNARFQAEPESGNIIISLQSDTPASVRTGQ